MSYLEAYSYITITIGIWTLYVYHRNEVLYDGDNIASDRVNINNINSAYNRSSIKYVKCKKD